MFHAFQADLAYVKEILMKTNLLNKKESGSLEMITIGIDVSILFCISNLLSKCFNKC